MLKRTQDRKTANLANRAGTQSVIANAFSLPSGKDFSCPGATSVCERICYAGKLERMYPSFRDVVMHNWNLVTQSDDYTLRNLLANMIKEFKADCVKRGAPKLFRIHADGDFFSLEYAYAWREVIEANPDIHFWVYTRSFREDFNVVPTLASCSNLSVYLSVDRDNRGFVSRVVSEYPDVRLAYLAETATLAAEGMREFSTKPGGVCPENIKRIPLITETGGACVSCGLCIFGKSNIRFAVKGR